MENQEGNDMAARGSRLPTPICSEMAEALRMAGYAPDLDNASERLPGALMVLAARIKNLETDLNDRIELIETLRRHRDGLLEVVAINYSQNVELCQPCPPSTPLRQ